MSTELNDLNLKGCTPVPLAHYYAAGYIQDRCRTKGP